MTEIVHSRATKQQPASLLSLWARKVMVAVRNFDEDEEGMNTVEAIILLFVAAIVLLVFFTLIWPLIRDKVMEKLNDLFGRDGNG